MKFGPQGAWTLVSPTPRNLLVHVKSFEISANVLPNLPRLEHPGVRPGIPKRLRFPLLQEPRTSSGRWVLLLGLCKKC